MKWNKGKQELVSCDMNASLQRHIKCYIAHWVRDEKSEAMTHPEKGDVGTKLGIIRVLTSDCWLNRNKNDFAELFRVY